MLFLHEPFEVHYLYVHLQQYENYSFEELRYAAPVVRCPSENMLVRANNDGTYCANWTPGGVGFYNVHITIDGFDSGERLLTLFELLIHCFIFTFFKDMENMYKFKVAH